MLVVANCQRARSVVMVGLSLFGAPRDVVPRG